MAGAAGQAFEPAPEGNEGVTGTENVRRSERLRSKPGQSYDEEDVDLDETDKDQSG